jgi:ATP-dependent RNA circularization protein (DNA/RNA ligase family)
LEIKPEFQKDHSTKIQLTDELGLIMKYPSLKVIQNIKSENEVDKLMQIIFKCIESIYDKNSMYYTKDVSEEELKDFVESLTQQQFVKVQKFFESVPKMKKNLSFKCNKCGYEDTVLVEGIQNFFE